MALSKIWGDTIILFVSLRVPGMTLSFRGTLLGVDNWDFYFRVVCCLVLQLQNLLSFPHRWCESSKPYTMENFLTMADEGSWLRPWESASLFRDVAVFTLQTLLKGACTQFELEVGHTGGPGTQTQNRAGISQAQVCERESFHVLQAQAKEHLLILNYRAKKYRVAYRRAKFGVMLYTPPVWV